MRIIYIMLNNGFHGAWVRFREHIGATRLQAASVMEELVYNIE